MNLENLECFITVASFGNFTRAAEKMFMAQSTVSRRVQKLEDELGETLIVREAPTFKLTKKGLFVFERGRKILEDVASLEASVRDEGKETRGSVKVGFYGLLLHLDIASYTQKFLAEHYPLVKLTTYYNKVSNMTEDRKRQKPDIVVAPQFELPKSGCVVRTLIERKVVALIPREHPFSSRNVICLKDLRDEPMVFWERDAVPGFYDSLVGQCEEAGFSPQLNELYDLEDAIVMSVAAGNGISILFDKTSVPINDDIVQLPVDDLHIPVDVAFAYEEDRLDSSIAAISKAFEIIHANPSLLTRA